MAEDTELLNSDQEENSDSEPEKQEPADKMPPEHPRFKAVLERAKIAEEEKSRLERELAELKTKQIGRDGLNEDEEAALERIFTALKNKKGILTTNELDEIRTIEKREQQIEKLSDKYSGKNGLPKFEIDDVVVHAKASGFGNNYEAAYRDLHFDTFVDLEAKKKVAPPPTTEKPGVSEREVVEGLTMNKISNMSAEEFEKHEAEIDAWMKQQVKGTR